MSQPDAAAGHVFVVKGDVRRLACDVYLQSTDRDLNPHGGWVRAIPDAPERLNETERVEFQQEHVFAIPVHVRDRQSNEPTPILVAVPYDGTTRADQLRERLVDYFRVASRVISDRGQRSVRSRPLVGLPMFADRGGGGGPVRGDILRVLYDEARRAVDRYEFDVALVLSDPRTYDLAQVIRREIGDAWPALDPNTRAKAESLGKDAAAHRLVPFMGSGVSVSAGAPTWPGLIAALADAAGLPADIAETLAAQHDVLDQAEYLAKEFERKRPDDPYAFANAVIKAVDRPRYGLTPALLASLEAEQAITLNYDRLFEMAAADAGLERRVIPGPQSSGERWLLKLHGTVDRPDSIVLTRDHYLRYDADREALTSLAKATLMTRRLLFVGFGMTDSHFHEIAHDVRRALPAESRTSTFGTVLTLTDSDVMRRLWDGELEFIAFPQSPRAIEIFLDAVMARACDGHSYLLADGYASTLTTPDAALRTSAEQLIAALDAQAKLSPGWVILERALRELGWDGASGGPSRRASSK